MTPMEFILRFTSTNPDLDTTSIGTINPAHLQANLDILQQGQGISFAAILVNTTPEYATICLSPSGGRSHTRSVELQRDTKISRFLLARNVNSNPSPSTGESDANLTSKLVRFAFVDDL